MEISQRNFNKLVDTFNHRVTRIESDVKWMKRIGYYLATVLTAIAIKSII